MMPRPATLLLVEETVSALLQWRDGSQRNGSFEVDRRTLISRTLTTGS